jgi:peroxiredoxin
MERTESSSSFALGSKLPSFTLRNVDDSYVESLEFLSSGKAALVIFTCNHCPYVKGSEVEMNKVIQEFQSQGLRVLAINSNDAEQYPDDSFEKMKEKSDSLELSYPYLYDQSQEVAKLFDAACTPECYLFDAEQKLVFHGTVNDNPRDPTKASKGFLAAAIKQVLAGESPNPNFVHPIGCSIKWK